MSWGGDPHNAGYPAHDLRFGDRVKHPAADKMSLRPGARPYTAGPLPGGGQGFEPDLGSRGEGCGFAANPSAQNHNISSLPLKKGRPFGPPGPTCKSATGRYFSPAAASPYPERWLELETRSNPAPALTRILPLPLSPGEPQEDQADERSSQARGQGKIKGTVISLNKNNFSPLPRAATTSRLLGKLGCAVRTINEDFSEKSLMSLRLSPKVNTCTCS